MDADTHGCAPTKCTEGYACPADTRCGDGAYNHGCVPLSCTDGYICPAGTHCGPDAGRVDNHGCTPTQCTDGYTCPGNLACLPTASRPDDHGCAAVTCTGVSCPVNQTCQLTYGVSAACVAKSCTTDSDCDCGACVAKYCAPRLSICVVYHTGGAHAAPGGGGGGATGSGRVKDSGMGGASGTIDGGQGR